jgi:hypothetical protein
LTNVIKFNGNRQLTYKDSFIFANKRMRFEKFTMRKILGLVGLFYQLHNIQPKRLAGRVFTIFGVQHVPSRINDNTPTLAVDW